MGNVPQVSDAKKKKKKKKKKKAKSPPTAPPASSPPAPVSPPPPTSPPPPPASRFVFDRGFGTLILDERGALYTPEAVATDFQGNVYVGNSDREQIVVFDANGSFIREFGRFRLVSALAFNHVGILYVANFYRTDDDRPAHRIDMVNFNDDIVGTLESPYVLGEIEGIAFDSNGHCYACVPNDGIVYEWDENNDFVTRHFISTDGGPVIDSEDRLYLTDNFPSVINVYDLRNNFTKVGSISVESGAFLAALAIADDRTLFAVDQTGSAVYRYSWDAQSSSYVETGSAGDYGSGNLEFDHPGSVAVGINGSIYVADIFNDRVQHLTSDLEFVHSWGQTGTGVNRSVSDLAIDSQDNLYVLDVHSNVVSVYASNGDLIGGWGSRGDAPGQFDRPFHIAISPDDIIYVNDFDNSRIQRFDTSGNPVDANQAWLTGMKVTGLAIARTGEILVFDRDTVSVDVYDESGTRLNTWSAPGLTSSYGFAIGPDNTVYIADYDDESDASTVKTFTLEGMPKTSWFFGEMGGMALDAAGQVYISDYRNNRVRAYTPQGTELFAFGAATDREEPGKFNRPGQLAFDSQGNLYIASSRQRVERFRPGAGRATSPKQTRSSGDPKKHGRKRDARDGNDRRSRRRRRHG